MKSLIVLIENYAFGGANKYAEDVISSLSSIYDEIEILGNEKSLNFLHYSRLPKNIKKKEIIVFNTGEKIKKLPRWARLLTRPLLTPVSLLFNICSLTGLNFHIKRKKHCRVIAFNGGYPASLYNIFALIFINKKMHTYLSIVSTPSRKKNLLTDPIWTFVDRLLEKNIRKIIVNSESIQKEMVQSFKFDTKSFTVLKNGIVDLPLMDRKETVSINIGFASRLEPSKGVRELLTAFKALIPLGIEIRLELAGAGSLEQEVINFCSHHPNISYLGPYQEENVHELLKRFDILVLPSYQEGLPYSLMEAARAGCALVGSRVGGIPEIIKDGLNGFLIEAKNPQDLEKVLKKMILNKEETLQQGKESRSRFILEFTLDKMKDSAINIIN